MLPKRPLAALLAAAVALALLSAGAEAHADPEPQPEPNALASPDFFGNLKKEFNKIGNAVKGAVRRMRIGCKCKPSDLSCRCCTPINVPELKFKKEVCLKTRFRLTDFTAIINIIVARKSIAQRSIAVNKTPPICVPVPKVPVLQLCVQAYNLGITRNRMRVCLKLKVKFVRNTIIVITFDCMHINIPKRIG